MIKCIDFFCGLGGLTRGLLDSGVSVEAGLDIDPTCSYSYEANNSSRFICKDVTEVDAGWVNSLFGKCSFRMLAGCAPCQPFSTYSRPSRKSSQDHRWQLLEDFGRIVRETRPEFVTMENVPSLISQPVFGKFLQDLHGYNIDYSVINSIEYGVPQTRQRLVLVASLIAPIRFLPPPQTQPLTVRDAISHLRPLEAGQSDPTDPVHVAASLSDLNLKRIRASKPGGTWRDWEPSLLSECHKRPSGLTFPSVYGRMEWDEPAPTITTQFFGFGNGRFGHPEQDRAITPREAALLQTFPEAYQLTAPGEIPRFSTLGRHIGNAVPVELARAIGRTFAEHARIA